MIFDWKSTYRRDSEYLSPSTDTHSGNTFGIALAIRVLTSVLRKIAPSSVLEFLNPSSTLKPTNPTSVLKKA